MKKIIYSLTVILAGVLLFSLNVNATPYPSPAPILDPTLLTNDIWTFGADLDDSGLFMHSSQAVTIELIDFGDLNLLGGSGVGSSFGFYFEGADVTNLANIHGIFDIFDITAWPFAPVSQLAVINFNQGVVFDVDAGVIQDSFVGSGNIGFAILPDPTLCSPCPILFTEPFLNPGGVDITGTFPIMGSSLPDPYLLTFHLIDPSTQEPIFFAADIALGVTPVPEPGTLILLSGGLAGLGFLRGRKQKKLI